MYEDDAEETALVLSTFPHDGIATGVREVAFGPASDSFALLWEIDPNESDMHLTIGNSPPPADIPTTIPDMLRELANEVEKIGDRADFLEWVYGEPDEEYDED